MARKGVSALAIVLVGTAVFALCLVSAIQLLKPHNMPIGVTGPSPVISTVQAAAAKEKSSVELINYSSEAELIQAAERGEIYVRGAFQDDRDPSLNRGALWKGEEHRGDQVAAEQRGQLLRNARRYVSRTLRQDVPLIGTRDGAHV